MGTEMENTKYVQKVESYNENVKCTPSQSVCITLISCSICRVGLIFLWVKYVFTFYILGPF